MENSTRYEAPSLQDLCLKVFQKDLISKATPSTVEYVRDGIDCWQTVIKGRGGEKDFRYSHFPYSSDRYLTIPLFIFLLNFQGSVS